MTDDAQIAAWLDASGAERTDPGAHEALRAEIDKLGAAHGREPDWEAVERLSTTLLGGPRKDLRVATYLASALATRRGGPGVLLGLRLLTALLALAEDALLPVRARARGAALSWYVAHAATCVTGLSADRQGHRERLRAALADFEVASRRALGDDAPDTSGLRAWLAAEVAPEPTPVAQRDARAMAAVGEPSTTSLPEPALATPVERAVHLAAVAKALVQNGRARFAADSADPGAYRVRRVGAGLCFERTPAANKRGLTELDPPAAAARASVAASVRSGDWHEALATVEALLDACPLWIDGHYLSAQALAGLGPRYAAAHAVVTREAGALVARLPGLTALCFADGTPLASVEARQWLAPSEPTAHGTAREAAPDEALAELVARAARGEREAVRKLEELRAGAAGASARFRLVRALAAALEAAGRKDEAALLWRGLAQEVVAHDLASWQPDAALSVLRGLERTHASAPCGEARTLAAELARHAPLALLDTSVFADLSKGA